MDKFKNFFKQLVKKRSKEKGLKSDIVRTYSFGVLLLIILIFLISLMFPRGKSYQFSLKEGEIYVGDKIIAPFTFAINKTDEEYKRDINDAKKEILPVFIKDDSICEKQSQRLKIFFNRLENIVNKNGGTPLLTNQISEFLKQNKINPDEETLKFFQNKIFKTKIESSNRHLIAYPDVLVQMICDIYSIGILNLNKNQINSQANKIAVLVGNVESDEDLGYFHDMEDVKSVVIERLRSTFENEEFKVNVSYRILMTFLVPNMFFDEQETNSRINEAVANVPRAKGTVLENEKIIDSYEKVTKEHIAKLNSLAIEKAEREAGTSFFLTIFRYAGKILMVCIGLSILVIFLIFNRQRLLASQKKVILVSVIILLVTFLSYIVNKFTQSSYLIPITIASMLLTIFFDTRLSFVGTVALSIILGGMRGNDFIMTVVAIFVGTAAILSVAKVRSRSWFFKSILTIIAAYFIAITTIEILRYTSLSKLLEYWLHGLINGFLSPLMAYGLQVLFEYIFDMTTDLRLLELSDLNRPLLRRLAVEAPGTYHHCIMVGSLAETAAEAIGANALLARVGSYYHDIGKIEKPEYFIENIQKTKNPHERLSPSMSCLILTNHVRRGLELAEEYRLPPEIKDFIAEHHGTNVMTYFYNKAVEQSKNDEVDISTFRYPGPKPHSKETGIVMLADSIEAASRTLKDPSASRIKGMVNSIVRERFEDLELDDSPLTLRDLTKIIDSFTTILLGTFHARIEYPNQDDKFFPKNNVKEKLVEAQN